MLNTLVDTHAHVFTPDLPMVANRRYTPARAADTGQYLRLLDAHGVGFGVLVQPSFLGTDNSYMLAALEQSPDRLCGIAVVDTGIKDAELELLSLQGITGIRFNLVGDDPGKLRLPEYRSLVRRVAELGWQIEIQAEGGDIPGVLKNLAFSSAPVVIDHFGKPDPRHGTGCRGFQTLLDHGPGGNVYVKTSASYRCGGADTRPYFEALMEYLGPDRLLWGSDWPWTQFEAGRAFALLPGFRRDQPREPSWAELFAGTALSLFFPVVLQRQERMQERIPALAVA